MFTRIHLDPTGAEGGKTPPAPETPPADTFDEQAAVTAVLAKHGADAQKALGYLLRDNQSYRRKLSELKAKVPADGAVVLTGDDLKRWTAYATLGNPEDLSAALADRDRFKAEADGFRTAELHKQVADAHGYKVPVLARLASQDQLTIEMRDTKVAGTPAKVAVVMGQDDKGKPVETPLPEYAKAHWAEFLTALAPDTSKSPPGTPGRTSPFPAHPRERAMERDPREASTVTNF
jgi:hypothetical protein